MLGLCKMVCFLDKPLDIFIITTQPLPDKEPIFIIFGFCGIINLELMCCKSEYLKYHSCG